MDDPKPGTCGAYGGVTLSGKPCSNPAGHKAGGGVRLCYLHWSQGQEEQRISEMEKAPFAGLPPIARRRGRMVTHWGEADWEAMEELWEQMGCGSSMVGVFRHHGDRLPVSEAGYMNILLRAKQGSDDPLVQKIFDAHAAALRRRAARREEYLSDLELRTDPEYCERYDLMPVNPKVVEVALKMTEHARRVYGWQSLSEIGREVEEGVGVAVVPESQLLKAWEEKFGETVVEPGVKAEDE